MLCTKSLYKYLYQKLLGVKAINLPLVIRRSIKKFVSNKYKLRKPIELHDAIIKTQKKYDHGEIDTVYGAKDKTNDVLISLIRWKSKLYIALRCPSARPYDIKKH